MQRNHIITNSAAIVPKQVLAEKITILADNSQTGSYEVYVHDAPQDAGPPPHSHPWDEAFYVTEGEVEFTCGGANTMVTKGGFVHVPAGTIHCFRYASPTAQILGITSGKGAAKMFSALDRECGSSPDMGQVLAVLGSHDVSVAT